MDPSNAGADDLLRKQSRNASYDLQKCDVENDWQASKCGYRI